MFGTRYTVVSLGMIEEDKLTAVDLVLNIGLVHNATEIYNWDKTLSRWHNYRKIL